MPGSVVVDAGPLVAWLDAADAWHEWAKSQFARLRPPLTTCEPVLTEAAHLVARGGGDPLAVVSLVAKGMLVTRISVSDQAVQLERLMRRYRTLPMSLADACLVRMAEVLEEAVVMTFDSDVRIYRAHGRRVIRLLCPEGM